MYKNYRKSISSFLFLYTISMSASSPGTIDTTYGSGGTGFATLAIGRSNTLNAIATLTNDTIIGVGSVTVLETVGGICRLNTDGSFDTTFNGTGYTQLSVGSSIRLNSIVVQSDGYAVIGGQTIINNVPQFILARYDTTGILDPSFGGIGYVVTDIGDASAIGAIALQSDGKIVAGGTAGQGNPGFAIARYNTDGSLDSSFGEQGIARINPAYTASINAIAIQPDGSIVVAGSSWNFSSNNITLVRFTSDGTIDSTFGTNGVVITPINPFSSDAVAIAVQTNNAIVVAGNVTTDYQHYLFTLVRYDSSGNLDTSFNETGIVTTEIDYSAQITSMLLQADGSIVVGGNNFGPRNTTFALARYTTLGALDTTFGTNGITLTTINSLSQINSLSVQSDGKIMAAGLSDDLAVVARYFS